MASLLFKTAALAGGALMIVTLAPAPVEAVPLPRPRPIPRNVIPQTAKSLSQLPAQPKLNGAPPPAPLAAKPPVQAAPPPRPLASKSRAPLAVAPTSTTSRADLQTLQQIIDLVRAKRQQDATQMQSSISDPLARKLSEWIILRSEDNGASSDRYLAFITENPSWPSQTFFRRRGEAALWDDRRDDSTILAFFGNEQPLSAKGRFALARALLNRGDQARAARLVRTAWHEDFFTSAVEDAALSQFSALLSGGDYKRRMEELAYGSDTDGALRAAKHLGGGYVALTKARIGLNRRTGNPRALLNAVPANLRGDPLYVLSRIQYLRREDKITEAARLMLDAPRDPARLVNTNEWWIERRLLARKLIDIGEHRTAYRVARDAAIPERGIYKTEREFTAGWIALRFLKDPATAAQHFARIGINTTNPTAQARAGYWQGRAAEAAGRSQEARTAYQAAAVHSTSYYGQLARAKLHLPQLSLAGKPATPRGASRLEVVRAVELLYALDEGNYIIPIMSDMGENADPDALAALCDLAERNNDPRGMLIAGKAALNRGLPFDHYAYPVNGIPPYRNLGPQVEKAIVFAIARQESAFNPTVVSPANAYGLMQVTPGAAKYVTKKYGGTYDLARLKGDPPYNAMLGAAELGGLIEDYRGSYIMTFAGYNAGRGSVRKWVARYGDPRDASIDAVDWVELIPFSETRNYVQRVMENLQVYRARFGGSHQLLIEADLRRGAVQ
ncbi:putative lytic transglycosylase [Afipia carboxidovorans OM5]|uniref:Putative lytic transglycosylase n=1 Tax=Afipia carboxidovorans (strain ATCC 49405 / DSM 1227 / KCTC 32145 / OM5) TaxID=504832 RepID=F8BXQ3_AFIC5|nr:putative lytic transglycosylase [Afipia carboxidovorans OM4]AEI06890.1 putative lytic transglycosylase [Afipia carboxidovorans OM5]